MKIIFVIFGVENLGVEFLSSFLKKNGHDVEVAFDPTLFASDVASIPKFAEYFDIKKELVREIIEKKPDLVGFSVLTNNYQRALEIALSIKESDPGIPIIFGGIHVTSVPELVIKKDVIDMICIGEGEFPLLELLNNMENECINYKIDNIWYKKDGNIIRNPLRPLLNDLDSLPLPDKDIYYKVNPHIVKNDYYTISSRGCPYKCTFCSNNILRKRYKGLGKSVRRRSPGNIIEELTLAKEKYRIKRITFLDDVFIIDVKWLREFAELYRKQIKLPYAMITHPRFIKSEVTKLLVDSGCYYLMYGIQSASEKTRMELLKRNDKNEEIEKAAANCHKVNLAFSVDHLFNIPTEGMEEHKEALNMYNKIRPSAIHTFALQYFPGTEIIEIASEYGIIDNSMHEKINEGMTSTVVAVVFGHEDTINPEYRYNNMQMLMNLLPLVPKKIMDTIIKRKIFMSKIKPPNLIIIVLKYIANVINKRGHVYHLIIRNHLYFAIKILSIKYRNKIQSMFS